MDYSDKVVDHYTHPRNVGKIEDASGIGEVGNPVCGDIMKIFIKVENNIITEMIKGKTVEEALALKNSDVVKALDGLPPVKLHCSVLAEEAIHEAIADYYRREGKLTEEEIKAKCNLKEHHCEHCG